MKKAPEGAREDSVADLVRLVVLVQDGAGDGLGQGDDLERILAGHFGRDLRTGFRNPDPLETGTKEFFP